MLSRFLSDKSKLSRQAFDTYRHLYWCGHTDNLQLLKMLYAQGEMCYFHFIDEEFEAEKQCISRGNAHQ